MSLIELKIPRLFDRKLYKSKVEKKKRNLKTIQFKRGILT